MKRLFVFACLLAGCQEYPRCVETVEVVRVFGCENNICQVVFSDGYIANIKRKYAEVGMKGCALWKR